MSGLAVFFLLAVTDFLNLFRSLARLSTAPRRPFFRPCLEGLETRWCPAIYHWKWNPQLAANWTTQGDWEIWIPSGGGSWQATNQTPGTGDTAQFDGTSTKLCTVNSVVKVAEVDITVAGGGVDQIYIAQDPANKGFSLEGKMIWKKDNVQIGFGDTKSYLIADDGSNIQSFTFDNAKGVFEVFGGTSIWSTSASSTTNAQIWVAGGTFDVQSTGTCTSKFGGVDVWVSPACTLTFDYGAGVTVADLFDNNNDGAGYLYVASNSSSGALGMVTTTAKTMTVGNKMPIRTTGSVVVDTGELDFYRSVAGANNTRGLRAYPDYPF